MVAPACLALLALPLGTCFGFLATGSLAPSFTQELGKATCVARRDARWSGSTRHKRTIAGGMSMMFDQLTSSMGNIASMLQGKKRITEASIEGALQEVKRALLDADVNLKVTNDLVSAVKAKAVGVEITSGVTADQQFVKIMYDELVRIMGEKQAPLARREDGRPTVVLLAGLQGAGKTTAAAKLAYYCIGGERPRKVLLVAGDIYRPAAIEQLQLLGKSIDVEVFSMGTEASPVDIATAGLEAAVAGGFDTVIVDTAGRQVVDDRLMAELVSVKEAVTPDEVLLVVDAMTGQEAATLTRVFDSRIGITGAILTKLDGDTRGGSALSVQGVSGKPIKFVGVGETVASLEPFYPERMAGRILGMGDVVSLVEKAQKEVSEEEAMRLTKKMMDATFDFNDFLQQAKLTRNMGNMANVVKMLPGMSGVSQAKLDEAEERIERAEACIKAMTVEERATPELLISDRGALERQRRVARDAGMRSKDVTAFISEFQRMRIMMSRMSKQAAGANTSAAGEGLEGGMGGGSPLPQSAQEAMMLGNRQQRRAAKKMKGDDKGAARKGFGKR